MHPRIHLSSLAVVTLSVVLATSVNAEVALDSPPPEAKGTITRAPQKQSLEKSVQQGIAYLKKTQAEDGSWSSQTGIGVTALNTAAVLSQGVKVEEPVVAKALKNLEANIREDGGIYSDSSRYRNYETCLAVMALLRANGGKEGGKYDAAIASAEQFVKGIQWDEEEGYDRTHVGYGGAGYGKHNRPDLSNTAFLMETLKELGTDANDPAMYRALAFVSRTQNLPSEHNQAEAPKKNPDGGFYYTPIAGGSSQAGETENGGLRSYGSMTYAGLKSMIYAGVDRDDPRVKAAFEWISKYYTLQENPGLGTSGLYYYFHTFAKALDAIGEDTLTDADGSKHNWRNELAAALIKRQREDGSWANENERWLEADANLSTGYALMALSYCEQ